ncbi:cell division protein CrgA [Aquipuribacter sp. SD81]|uniref:cell division protein CrgA n=1 Tax=Aquipuribacter sp. SD81 TaxID=3127703 RepID=UPI0030188BF0
MPESTPPRKKPAAEPAARSKAPTRSPQWWAPLMVVLMVVGLVWIVVFYVTQQAYPIPGINLWNLGIGFAIAMAGFLMTTRWR